MNIMIASDDNYIPPALILLVSIFENTREKVDIWYFYDKLSDNSIKKLNDIVEKWGGTLHLVEVKDEVFDKVPLNAHFTKETYFRLLVADLLPKNIERVLYLDPDIVINKDIQDFYYQPFNEYALVACLDSCITNDNETIKRLKLPKHSSYFNAGVLLINLDYYRKNINVDEMFKYIENNADSLKYCDQDVLNVFFAEKVKFCEPKYNLLLCNISASSKKIEEAVVLHYAGSQKPWKAGYKHGALEIYNHYAENAGMKEWLVKNRRKSVFKQIKKYVKHRL